MSNIYKYAFFFLLAAALIFCLYSCAKKPDAGEIRLAEHMEKTLNYPPKDEDFPYSLKGLKDVRITGALTGEYSINKTRSNYGVNGTDIGLVFDRGDEIFFAFGDTFSKPSFGGDWRSNVLAVSSDRDASDGILFDRMISEKGKRTAKEIISSLKTDDGEKTTIPTGGFSVGEELYLCYMSVREWGEPGVWSCNYGGIAKSADSGDNWEKQTELQWDGDGKFIQLYPVKYEEYIYFFAVQGGRTGPVSLMRARAEDVENRTAYEYLTELPEDGPPVYLKGGEAEKNALTIIESPAGELSVMYNEYLGEWLITYLWGEDLIVRSSKALEGPYSEPHYIAKQTDFPGLYCAFMHPAYTEEGGRFVYFMMSLWDPVYNVVIVKAEMLK